MERAQVLGALRLPAVVFPSGWPITSKPNQRELIAWLLRHDPVTRPTATQVLQSSLLPPPEKEKEYYTAAITGTSHHKPG
jgi:translation initiation factor 2-alpha kinase 4